MKSLSFRIALVSLCLAALFGFAFQPSPATAAPGADAAKIERALYAAMQKNPAGQFSVIVQTAAPGKSTGKGQKLNAARAKGALDRLKANGAAHLRGLDIIGGAAAKLSANAITALSRDPFVSYIRIDHKLSVRGTPGSLSLYTQITHANDVWAQGINGRGIAVAVLDSGVAPVDDLAQPSSRIIASVDMTNAPAPGDPGGHGTHVAGIVAGNGTDSGQAREGVAPGANIVNVRVIGENGTTSLSTVISGLQWVVQNKTTYNIRVVNLSLGGTSYFSYRDDVLAAAVEMVWANGIVVVASAGNSGPGAGTIDTPGIDPFIITVGALDDNGTLSTSDDIIASFSAQGPTLDGLHKPDLVAPGRKIVSLRAVGSYLDKLLPDRVTDTKYFRLSGTSQSAPVVAGIVALMLQKNPGLKPDQVKGVLMSQADPVASNSNRDAIGAGMVNAYRAVNAGSFPRANRGLTPSDEFAKAVRPVLQGMSLANMWRDPWYKGINWGNIGWDNIGWDRTTWENLMWENIGWDNIGWDNIGWDNIGWDSASWDTFVSDDGGDPTFLIAPTSPDVWYSTGVAY